MAPLAPVTTVEVNGSTLAYRDMGQGEPIVLVHGSISDIRTWDAVQSDLAERFRVLAYSRRYATPNAPITEGFVDPWGVHVDDLAAFIEKLGLGSVHAVGNSSGAFVALLLAKQRPDLVRTLVLEEPPVVSLFLPSLPPKLSDVVKLLFSRPAAFLPLMAFGTTVVRPVTNAFERGDDEKALEIFARGVLGETFYANLSPSRLEQMRENVKPHRASFLGGGLPSFLEEDARAVTTPTLLMMGEHTPQFQKEINRRLVELIPGAQEHVVSGASHLMHEDNPRDVLAAISTFATAHSRV
jgi:pimeloyl-ACP methyl ester carboxylesterase